MTEPTSLETAEHVATVFKGEMQLYFDLEEGHEEYEKAHQVFLRMVQYLESWKNEATLAVLDRLVGAYDDGFKSNPRGFNLENAQGALFREIEKIRGELG